MNSRAVVLCNPVRTAIDTYGGSFNVVCAPDLGATAIRETLKRAGLAADKVQALVMGHVIQAGAKMNPDRQAGIAAGLPMEVPALRVNRVYDSGAQAIAIAALKVNRREIEMNAIKMACAAVLSALMASPGALLAQGGMRGGMGGMSTNVQAPADNPITPEKVELGKQLYFDGRLSKDGTISCNSCHDLSAAGADTKAVSTGVGGAQGARNSPTVWNSAFHNAQFWDGRAGSLEEQAKGPLVNPVEMAMPSVDAVVARVKAVPGYVKQFDKVFGPNSVTIDTIAKAIATYERTLVSTGSKFDSFRFVDKGALTEQEWQGFQAFRQVGCVQCHMGPDFSGPPPLARGAGFYQKFPRFPDSPLVSGYKLLEDQGRYTATGRDADRHVYRVPSLRNVKETAPYFHNGSAATLEEAVRVCAKGGNNRDLTPGEVKALAAFLGTLSGTFPEQKAPKLP